MTDTYTFTLKFEVPEGSDEKYIHDEIIAYVESGEIEEELVKVDKTEERVSGRVVTSSNQIVAEACVESPADDGTLDTRGEFFWVITDDGDIMLACYPHEYYFEAALNGPDRVTELSGGS